MNYVCNVKELQLAYVWSETVHDNYLVIDRVMAIDIVNQEWIVRCKDPVINLSKQFASNVT